MSANGALHALPEQGGTRALGRPYSVQFARTLSAVARRPVGRGLSEWVALWRDLRRQGFRGCRGVLSEWSARRKRAEKAEAGAIGRAPPARTIARLLTIGRDQLSKTQTITVAAIERGVGASAETRDILAEFQTIIRRNAISDLVARLARDRQSHSFVRKRHYQGQTRRRGRNRLRVIQRPDRRPDLQAQACQTPDIRAWRNRPA
jgi:hypothetical protein